MHGTARTNGTLTRRGMKVPRTHRHRHRDRHTPPPHLPSSARVRLLWPLSAGPSIYVTVSAIAGLLFAVNVQNSRPSDILPQKRSSRKAMLQKIDLHHPASKASQGRRPTSANYIREPPLSRRFETALLLHSCNRSMPYLPSTSLPSKSTVGSVPHLLSGWANMVLSIHV